MFCAFPAMSLWCGLSAFSNFIIWESQGRAFGGHRRRKSPANEMGSQRDAAAVVTAAAPLFGQLGIQV